MVYWPPWKLAQYQMVWPTLIPLRAVTEPRPSLEQLTRPVTLTAFASACWEDWADNIGANVRTPANTIKEIPAFIILFMAFSSGFSAHFDNDRELYFLDDVRSAFEKCQRTAAGI